MTALRLPHPHALPPLGFILSTLILAVLLPAATARSQPRVDARALIAPPAACGLWTSVLPPEAPFAAYDFVPVHDAARNRIVLFGGRNPDGTLRRELWQLDLAGGGAWSLLSTTGTPPTARAAYGALLDPARDRMILFGGDDGGPRNDLWALDLGTHAWSQLATTGFAPPPRHNHAVVHDALRDRMIVIGGTGGSTVNADLYAVSLATMDWDSIPAPGGGPGFRHGHTAVHDAARDRVIVYGGFGVPDLFELDLAAPAWTPLSAGGAPPANRSEHTAVLDVAGDRMLVFGGEISSVATNESWSLQLSPTVEWVPLAPAGSTPVPRRSHGAVFASGSMRMLGGAGGVEDETWRLSFDPAPSWTEVVPAGKPMRERESHTAIWDPQASGLWIWGGRTADTTWEQDLWFVDPASPVWTHVTPSGSVPAARDEHTAILDAPRQRMLIFGGRNAAGALGDAWSLDLSGTPAWSVLASGPGARFGHAAVYDPVRERMLILAGNDGTSSLSDVWALSLTGSPAWTSLAPVGTAPSPRYGHVAVYDPIRDRVLVTGGTDGAQRFDDVWALDLAGIPTWTPLAPEGEAPPGLEGHAGVYDPVADRMVVFGGAAAGGKTDGSWALTLAPGPAWQPLLANQFVPQARADHAAAWDGASSQMLVAGGFGLASRTNDVASLSGNGLYSLVLASAPVDGGAANSAPDLNCFLPNTQVQLTAVPAAGFGFTSWSGDVGGTQNPLIVTMDAAKSIVATFTGHGVTTLVVPPGLGTVTRSPDRANYAPGEQLTLTATPVAGGAFSHWSGDASGSDNPLTLTVNGPLEITANFVGLSITTEVSPPGSGLVDRIPDSPLYAPGSQVELRAIPAGGYAFSHWSGDASGSATPITITVNGPLNVVANFIGYPLVTDVTPAGSGFVVRTPETPTYVPGSQVELRAVPVPGNDFSHWSGDASGTEYVIQLTMDGPKAVTANFVLGIYTLDVSLSPPGAGSVQRVPNLSKYAPGRIVTLTAQPLPGQYAFSGWSGDTTSTENSLSIVMNGNRSLTASFVGHTLVTQVTPPLSGSVSRSPNYPTYAPGSVVTLTANPAPGYTFSEWLGDAAGYASPLGVVMDGPKMIIARFMVIPPPPLTVLVTPGNGGVVNRSPPNAALGDTVTLTAVPNPGFSFAGWSGAAGGLQNPLTLFLDVPKVITAHFITPPMYFLSVSTSPTGIGWVFVEPNLGGYPPGTPVLLTATPPGAFLGWSGGATGSDNPLTLIMDESKSITASFLTYTMTVSVEPSDQGLYVVRTPDQSLYPASASVLLTAPTHLGLDFLHWSGDATGTQNPIAVPMDANKNVTAHFGGFPVVIDIDPPGAGTASAGPDLPFYAPGRSVTLLATPAGGFEFLGWTGDVTGLNPLVFTMPEDTVGVVAHFGAPVARCLEWQTLPGGASPGPRTRHSLALDAGRQRMILFGGLSGPFDRHNDVWVKALANDSSWIQIQSQGVPPDPRHSAAAIHDPVRNRLLVFGGRPATGVRNDVWALSLDGVPTWTQLTPAGTPPSQRFGAAAVYDPVDDRMIVFGGNSTASPLSDTWALALSGQPAWTLLNPQTLPGARYYAGAIHDPVRHRLIVVGGRASAPNSQFDDAWFLPLSTPSHWTELVPAGQSVTPRSGAGVAYDPPRDRLILYGGEGATTVLGDVAELSMVGRTAWGQLPVSASFQPPGRMNGAVVYDGTADRILVYGGEEADGDIFDDLLSLSFAGGLSVSVVVDPPGTGTYVMTPADPCVDPGSIVTLEALPSPGYRFLTWENLATSENPLTLTASNHMSVVARFAPITNAVNPVSVDFGIHGVSPNPARGMVRVDYALASEAGVTLAVLDVSGRVIASLVDGPRSAGTHSEFWDGRMGGTNAPEGIYFLRLSAGVHTSFRRVAILR